MVYGFNADFHVFVDNDNIDFRDGDNDGGNDKYASYATDNDGYACDYDLNDKWS